MAQRQAAATPRVRVQRASETWSGSEAAARWGARASTEGARRPAVRVEAENFFRVRAKTKQFPDLPPFPPLPRKVLEYFLPRWFLPTLAPTRALRTPSKVLE